MINQQSHLEHQSTLKNQNNKASFDPINSFEAEKAFARNLGWFSKDEQKFLSEVKVGIIGMGGVGGQYAEVLTRLGFQHFVICDPDSFSIENTNRQNECRVSNYGKNKAEVIKSLILDINPLAQVEIIPGALKKDQVEDFCRSIDIYIDSLDFFEVDLRIEIFKKMREFKKIALTAAPLGTGSSCIVFTPESMTFEDYFGFHRSQDIRIRSHMFLLGVSPSLQQARYLKEKGGVDFINKKVPSLPIGVYSCASLASATIIKLLLGRGKVYTAPWSVHYDPYLNRIKKTYLWLGYKNPLQRIKLWILSKLF